MKQMLIPKRGDLIVLYVGLSLLLCASFPAALLADFVQLKILRTTPTLWMPLHATSLLAAFGTLLAWTAFSQSAWWQRSVVFLVLIGAGLGLIWLSAHLINIIEAPQVFAGDPVWQGVLVGIVGLPLLAVMKYFLGIRILHGEQKAKAPNPVLLLIGAAVLLVPAMIIARLAQDYRDSNMRNLAGMIYSAVMYVPFSIGLPVYILSWKGKKWPKGLAFAFYLLLTCAIPIAIGIVVELDKKIWLTGIFRGWALAGAALPLMILIAVFVAYANGYRFVSMKRRGGKWLTEAVTETVQPASSRVNCSLVSWVFVALFLGGFCYFEVKHDIPTFVSFQSGNRFRNARFAKKLSELRDPVHNDKLIVLQRNGDFTFDPITGAIDVISIPVSEGGADALIADLGTLGEISKVRLYGEGSDVITSAQLESLAKCGNVHSIEFDGVRFDDWIEADFQNVESVTLVQTENTDAFLERLAENNSLKSLSIQRSDLTESGFENIKSMTNLRELVLIGNKLNVDCLRGVSRLKKLESLRLTNIAVDDATMENEIAKLSNLSSLVLSGSNVSSQGLQSLRSLPNLVTVELNGSELSPQDYFQLQKTAAFQITDNYFEYAEDWLGSALLQKCGDLSAALEVTASKVQRDADGSIVELEFDHVRITSRGLKELLAVSQLQSLDLEKIRMSPMYTVQGWSRDVSESLVEFQTLQNLERLRLPGYAIDDQVFEAMTKISSLSEISFDPAEISDELYPLLSNMPKLKRVRLLGGKVKPALITQLQSMNQIEEIVIVASEETAPAKMTLEQNQRDLTAALPGISIQIDPQPETQE